VSERRRARSSNSKTRQEARGEATAGLWDDASVVVVPLRKQAISLRIDEDVLAWFRGFGPRYQSRMNKVLRSYMDAVSAGARRPRGR
jgi:uncharacterized protein (DUF4415 family)